MNITKKRLVEIIKEEVKLSKKRAMAESWKDYEGQGTPMASASTLSDEDKQEAERMGYYDPHDDAFRNAQGLESYLRDKAAGTGRFEMEEAHGHLPQAGAPQIPDLFRMADELGAVAQNTFNTQDAHIRRKAEEIVRARKEFSEGLTKKQADAARKEADQARQDREDKERGIEPGGWIDIPLGKQSKKKRKRAKVREMYDRDLFGDEDRELPDPGEPLVASAVSSIINGLRTGELSPEGAAERLESVKAKLYKIGLEESK